MPARPAKVIRLPPRIVLDVNAELADYLAGELKRHWPQALVSRRVGQDTIADLLVVDREPRGRCCPTLWLAGIDGKEALTQLAPGYWRASMPTTAWRLRRTLEACLHALIERGASTP